MLNFDSRYEEFLKGTGVRYEMMAYGMDSTHQVEVNNYKSSQYFSENDNVSIGFFGMQTCEFETTEAVLSKGEWITIHAITPDFKEPKNVTGNIYAGNIFNNNKQIIKIIEEITWSTNSSYEAIPFAVENLGEDDAYYVYHIGVGDKYKYPNNITMDRSETIYFDVSVHTGVPIQKTLIMYDADLDKWYKGSCKISNKGQQFNFSTGATVGIFVKFEYDSSSHGVSSIQTFNEGIVNKEWGFEVFTGFVEDITDNDGAYKVSCRDTSDVLDVSADDLGLGGQPKSFNYVINAIMDSDYRLNGWEADENIYQELYDENKYFYYKTSMTKREVISSICAQVGANAFMNNEGKMIIKWYSLHYIPNSDYDTYQKSYGINENVIYDGSIEKNSFGTSFTFSEINIINAYVSSENQPKVSFSNGDLKTTGSVVNIYFKTMAYGFSENYCNKIFDKIRWTYGDNGQCEMVGNFALEVGDAVYISGGYYFLISQIEHECDGGLITKIYSYAYPVETTQPVDANSNYSGSSEVQQTNQDVFELKNRIVSLESNAVLSVKLNGNELKSGTTATIPMASDSKDGALPKELYSEITSEITTEQIDEWFGETIETNVYGNYTTELEVEPAMATAITGEEVSDD